jgi:DHA1 family bicyclomycin/chloramphenicol resistance-like MFS transporter
VIHPKAHQKSAVQCCRASLLILSNPNASANIWPLAALLAGLAMLGPFSIDSYLPAFPEMTRDLETSSLKIQQTLTVYLFAYAAMSLWHGALSDTVGRKSVIVATLVIYALATLGCAIAGNVQTLLLFRALQGMAAGGGLIVGRAIIRDKYHGADAQRLMARITLMFGVAPAIAPVIGGWVLWISGWRSIFWALLVFTVGMLIWTVRKLPETHPPSRRQPLHARTLFANYSSVFPRWEFQLLAGMVAFNFAGFFLYIPAAPVFLTVHLGVSAQGFAWLFLPTIAGIITGATLSGHLADRFRPDQTITLGYVLMGTAGVLNIALTWTITPALPWSILPLPLYACGMSLVMPSVTLLLLDFFPTLRGLTSSLQGFTHTMLSSIVAGAIAPALEHSMRALAGGMLLFSALGFLYWIIYRRRSR